jgi:hypothetical protein
VIAKALLINQQITTLKICNYRSLNQPKWKLIHKGYYGSNYKYRDAHLKATTIATNN